MTSARPAIRAAPLPPDVLREARRKAGTLKYFRPCVEFGHDPVEAPDGRMTCAVCGKWLEEQAVSAGDSRNAGLQERT